MNKRHRLLVVTIGLVAGVLTSQPGCSNNTLDSDAGDISGFGVNVASIAQNSLVVTPTGNSVEAVLKIHSSSGSVTLQSLTVAVRDAAGNNFDYPGVSSVVIGTTTYTYDRTKTFPSGTYTMFGAYQVGGTWYNLASQTVTISSGAGTRLGKSNVFWDDFTGSSINTSTWTINSSSSYPSNGPDNPADHKVDYFDSSAIAVSGGNVVFTASDAGFQISGFPQGGNLDAWHTGFLTTEPSGFRVQTGDYLEAKVLLPSGTGAWPALWTWKSGGNEIDVFEYHPDNPNLLELTNHVNGGQQYYTDATAIAPGKWVAIGVLLGASSVDWYVNGTKVFSDGTGVGTGWSSFINLNLSLSDGYYHTGPSGSPFTFSADYVGVWR